MRRIAAIFGGEPFLFEWSGENLPGPRHAAAARLAELLRSSSSPVHLLGFSHGGNIATEAAALLDVPVRTLITVATPVSGRYRLGPSDLHVHLYSSHDAMQRGGGEWIRLPKFGCIGWARRTYPPDQARNVHIDTSSSGTITGRHGDLLWREETWRCLEEILRERDISDSEQHSSKPQLPLKKE
jgi:pimeloyl-ACP methyl ester carboxylesterase